MKAMKQLLIVIALLSCTTMLMATEYQLHQTSKATYHSIGSGGTSSMSTVRGSMRGSATVVTMESPSNVALPTIGFYSTSTMSSSGSTLLSTDTDMVIGTDNPNPSDHGMSGPRKSRPGDNNDPFKDPLTDAVPCLLLLAIGYAIYLRKKTGLPTPDSRK